MSRTHPLRGIVLMLCAVGFFAVMDTLLKLLTSRYPPMQVSALRGAASLVLIVGTLLVMNRLRDLRAERPGMHVLRGLLMVAVMGGFLYAVRALSLADAYAIFLTAPLLVTAFAALMLREKVGWHRWTAILVGLAGALYMLRPSTSSFVTWGAVGAFVSAIAYALSAVLVRVLTKTETTSSVAVWSMSVMTLVSAAIAWKSWVAVSGSDWWIIAVIGVTGAIAQLLLIEAFRSAPASVIAPFEYTALLWGIAFDWLVWQVLPHSRVLIGGAIVVASGLYVIWRERLARAARAETAGTGTA